MTSFETSNAHRQPTFAHLCLLFVFSVFLSGPLLTRGIPDLSHDGVSHAIRQVSYSNQLWHGEWYPRWLSNSNIGLGSPTFFFYPAVPSYAASVFYPLLSPRDPDGWLQAGFGCALAIVLSAFTAYFWLRSVARPTAALSGAAVYVLAPYHLTIDTYARGAAAELWSFVWLPLILLSIIRIREGYRGATSALAVVFALLALSHLPTLICFTPVIVAATLFPSGAGPSHASTTTPSRTSIFRVFTGLFIGTGLSALYIAPALLDRSKVNVSQFVSDLYNFRRYWLYPDSGVNLKFSVLLLATTFSTVFFIAILYAALRGRSSPQRREAMFYLGVGIFGLVFMTQLSYPFWRYVPFLSNVSFPWRFGTLLVVSAAALSALAFDQLKKATRPVAAVLAAIVVSWFGCVGFAAWRQYSPSHSTPLPTDNRTLVTFHPDLCEFWPSTAVPGQACAESVASRVQLLQGALAGRSPKSILIEGQQTGAPASATLLSWQPRKVIIAVNASEQSRLTLMHFYYPDWHSHLEGSSELLNLHASPVEGFLQADIPQGQYHLVVELVAGRAERAGLIVSLGSLILLIGLTVFDYKLARTPKAGRIDQPVFA